MVTLIVDDHPLFRKAIKKELLNTFNSLVVHEADNGKNALEFVLREKVDLVLLDISMPVMDGFEFLNEVKARRLKSFKTIVLSLYDEPLVIFKLIQLGVEGYLSKNSDVGILVEAINAVLDNRLFFDNELDKQLTELIVNKKVPASLSPNDVAFISHLATGATSKEIAQRLGYTVRTVETKRRRLEKKFYAKNTAELIHKAYKLGILKI